jgi:mannosyltransferase
MSKDSPEKTDEAPRRAEKSPLRAGFFDRRVRLTGDSSFSIPLVLVLLFPCLVVVLILMLFARSPNSDELSSMPSGTPPSIR